MADGSAVNAPRVALAALNAMPAEGFAAALEGIFEHARWVAAGAAPARPFPSVAALHAGLMTVLRGLDEAERVRFLNLHPELSAGALPVGLTAASREEQGGAGLAETDAEELARLNAAYRSRHGIPFMICLRRHTAADVLRGFRARLGRSVEEERARAMEEVGHVSRLRLAARVEAPDAEPPRGAILLRALERAGAPFAGLRLTLQIEGTAAGEWTTDAAGRAGPLLAGEALKIGRYAILADGAALPFEVADPAADLALRLQGGAGGWRLTL
ncbi:2-oxo-4-hydroxy-4-carboxy-5-ureidoimidazoline decarboxylase [Roseomonas sp. KE2513]|uniref:2-oxo-4-hydroxy-4-carboxy-5-ureidoimidazoline decarboxylase n=1 Tax=Roseomonas sp. KE2513 TaxID=2479202 RepID=UPI0018DF76D1|nr:2-oxo-4-hydroxy-4-carboxy-5-ureidoimidazoline decarboxylase [Roseomonas sp. KE2513]MBI0535484.1 2-oxo-4-hydroxy-4-carboxy-5-ureidoimidazoline decarboxylase [Roseomonas sp. KE2513]